MGMRFHSPAVIKTWAVVVFADAAQRIDQRQVSGFAQRMYENMTKLGTSGISRLNTRTSLQIRSQE